MKKNWYLMPYRVLPGVKNMAVDLLLAREYLKWLDRPLLRFYGWQPDTISLGHSQPASDIDFNKADSAGVAIVRRPTGGRAIYHARELTYSIIYPPGELKKEALYHRVNIWFKKLLDQLGIESVVQNEQPDFKRHYLDSKSSPCFSAAARFELKVEGKKIVGSAQRIYANAILQHGSFMLGAEHLKLVEYLKMTHEEKESVLTNLKGHSTELDSHLMSTPTPDKAAEMFINILNEDGVVFERYTKFEDISLASEDAYKYVLAAESELV